MTSIDSVTSMRIERAKALSPATDRTCAQVGLKVRRNKQSRVTRTFKSLAGMMPRQFRKRK